MWRWVRPTHPTPHWVHRASAQQPREPLAPHRSRAYASRMRLTAGGRVSRTEGRLGCVRRTEGRLGAEPSPERRRAPPTIERLETRDTRSLMVAIRTLRRIA